MTINGDLRAGGNIQPDPNGLRNGNHPITVTGNMTEQATIEDPNQVEGYLARAFDLYDARYGDRAATTYESWSDLADDTRVTSPSKVEEGIDANGGSETYRVEDAEVVASDDEDGDGGYSTDGDLSVDGGTVTLEAGGEHAGFRFDDANLSGGRLVLNVTDGNLDLRVDDDFLTDGNSPNPTEIDVVGDGNARIYVDGNLSIGGPSTVSVGDEAELRFFHRAGNEPLRVGGDGVNVSTGANESADSFWLFSDAEKLTLDGGGAPINMTGVVYAPNANVNSAEGDITIRGALTVDGFGDPEQNSGNSEPGPLDGVNLTMRYDEALETAEVFDEVEEVPTVNYLHVSTQEIRIEDD